MRIANLRDNWDCEYAKKPTRASVKRAFEFAMVLMDGPIKSIPKIYPGVNGEITFEWENDLTFFNATIGEVTDPNVVTYHYERNYEIDEWQSRTFSDERYLEHLREFQEADFTH